jgi:hypothetical protein
MWHALAIDDFATLRMAVHQRHGGCLLRSRLFGLATNDHAHYACRRDASEQDDYD